MSNETITSEQMAEEEALKALVKGAAVQRMADLMCKNTCNMSLLKFAIAQLRSNCMALDHTLQSRDMNAQTLRLIRQEQLMLMLENNRLASELQKYRLAKSQTTSNEPSRIVVSDNLLPSRLAKTMQSTGENQTKAKTFMLHVTLFSIVLDKIRRRILYGVLLILLLQYNSCYNKKSQLKQIQPCKAACIILEKMLNGKFKQACSLALYRMRCNRGNCLHIRYLYNPAF